MKALYEQFLKEKLYLENLSPRTIKYFKWTFNNWDSLVGGMPDRQKTKDWVMKLVGVYLRPNCPVTRVMGQFFI